jgi:hypothetical protein
MKSIEPFVDDSPKGRDKKVFIAGNLHFVMSSGNISCCQGMWISASKSSGIRNIDGN